MADHRETFLSLGTTGSEFGRFVYALELVRARYPSMTLGAFATFLSITRSVSPDGLTATELAEKLGQPLPTIFRQCNQLSEGVPGKPGMKLIKKVENTKDGRSRKMSISVTGLGLLSAILEIIDVEDPERVMRPPVR